MLIQNSKNDNARPDTRRVMLTIQELVSESDLYDISPEEQSMEKLHKLYDFETGLVDDTSTCGESPSPVDAASYSIIDRDGFESYSCGSCRFEHQDLSKMITHCSTQTHLGNRSTEISLYSEHTIEETPELSCPEESSSVKTLCADTTEKALIVEASSQFTTPDKSSFLLNRNTKNDQIHRDKKSHESNTCDMALTRFNVMNINVHKQIYSCTICKKSISVDKTSSANTPSQSPYKCLNCVNMGKNTLSTSDNFPVRLRTHTDLYPHKCTCCEKTLSSYRSLTDHMRTHIGKKPLNCKICTKSFYHSGHLTVHMRIHTGEKPYECTICKKSFMRSESLKEHMRMHIEENPYECTICKKSFSSSGNLKSHSRMHTGGKPFECTVCKKSYLRSEYLTSHMRTHTGEKRYGCIICKTSFTWPSQLTIHMRTHTGENPYNCTICKKSFSKSCNLTVHIRTHTKKKP